jgi:lipopolysaccharide assembly outer membrane protein LptD (OstA)
MVMKKILFGSLVLSFVVVAIGISQGTPGTTNQKHAQIATPEGSNVEFTANSIQRQNQVMRLTGNVEIRTHDMSLHADDVTYDQKTGELEATGKVRIKLESQN